MGLGAQHGALLQEDGDVREFLQVHAHCPPAPTVHPPAPSTHVFMRALDHTHMAHTQSLVDDDLVKQEKIGISNYFW